MAMEEKATWRDPALGVARELDLPQGRLRYFEAGNGAPIVFAHGVLVNANLWRKVVARLSPEFRCIVLDLPLGSHTLPMPEAADLTPHGLADLIADAVEALALEGVTLVGNDTGGALCQMVVTRRAPGAGCGGRGAPRGSGGGCCPRATPATTSRQRCSATSSRRPLFPGR